MQVVKAPDEKQVGNLLDHLNRMAMPPDQNVFQIWST
jgi:hypothetical protein